jgi:hypothetical protein
MNQQSPVEKFVVAALREHGCPTPDVLAEFTLGLLIGTAQLRVAAHVRDCPLCAFHIELSHPPPGLLVWETDDSPTSEQVLGLVPETRPRRAAALPAFIARLKDPTLAEAYRSPATDDRQGPVDTGKVRQYVGADLAIDVTIPVPEGDTWDITGRVRRNDSAVAACTAILHAGRRRYTQITDATGFFTFATVPAGRYTLTVSDGQIQIRIQGLTLSLGDAGEE